MGKALFVGLTVIFFTAYVQIAAGVGVFGEEIAPLTIPAPPVTGGGFLDTISAVFEIFKYGFTMFVDFLKLITFQIPGQESASLLTAIIFVPLGFINGYIIFTAIRGS